MLSSNRSRVRNSADFRRYVCLQHRVTASDVAIGQRYALASIATGLRSVSGQNFKGIVEWPGKIQSTIRHHRALSQHVEFTRIRTTLELLDVVPPDNVIAVEAGDRCICLRSDDPDSSGQIVVKIKQQCATQAGRSVIGSFKFRVGSVKYIPKLLMLPRFPDVMERLPYPLG